MVEISEFFLAHAGLQMSPVELKVCTFGGAYETQQLNMCNTPNIPKALTLSPLCL